MKSTLILILILLVISPFIKSDIQTFDNGTKTQFNIPQPGSIESLAADLPGERGGLPRPGSPPPVIAI